MTPIKTLLSCLFFTLFACNKIEEYDLRNNFSLTDSIPPKHFLKVKDSLSGKLNYVRTLYATWRFNTDNPYIDQSSNTIDIENLMIFWQAFASLCDEKNVLSHAPSYYLPTKINPKLKKLKLNPIDAKTLILNEFKKSKVLMFNETPFRIECRIFVLNMLEELHKQGVTHLALDALDSDLKQYECIGSNEIFSEPIMAQIIRKTKKLGIQLICYKDTNTYDDNFYHYQSIVKHIKWKAVNFYAKIKDLKPESKIVLLSPYYEIVEDTISDKINFASYFTQISKINPLTVDQLGMLHASTTAFKDISSNNNLWPKESINGNAGQCSTRDIFDSLYHQKVLTPIAINYASMDSIYKYSGSGYKYDIYVYHPKTELIDHRANWLFTKDKSKTKVKIPNDIKPVFIQAYLSNEITKDIDFDFKVPFDQTSYVTNNEVTLVLDKNTEYIVVYRGQNNEILKKENITIK